MINFYTPAEIELIKQSGQITADALKNVIAAAVPGVSTLHLDKIAQDVITSHGGEPSFKMEKGYHFTTCMCVNDAVVHAIPTDYKLQEGDRLGIDLGTFYQGFHSDSSWSIVIAKNTLPPPELVRFLKTGQDALAKAIKQCHVGNHIGHISQAIQQTIEAGGYSCVKQLVGHGVGKKLHEDPEVPCYVRGKIDNTPEIKEGMVLAIEAIYNQGRSEVVYAGDDGWTIVTRDGTLSGLFESTVAVTKNGPVVLT